MKGSYAFLSREQAAEMLGSHLLEYKGRNPLVLAIPRGAVPMGRIIADLLEGELDIVLTHKLGAPFNSEYAIGAIDESGWAYIAPDAGYVAATSSYVEQEKTRQLDVLKMRRSRFSPHKKQADPKGRIAIVVDDGLATGATMIAALHSVRARESAELICAVPVAAPDSLKKIAKLADKIVCLYAPEGFRGVSQFYRDFPQVEEDEVIAALSPESNLPRK
jgi:putative phosphoribosyl transferase